MSYRRTNDEGGQEVKRSTAGATGGGDHDVYVKITHFASDDSLDIHDGYVTDCAACGYADE